MIKYHRRRRQRSHRVHFNQLIKFDRTDWRLTMLEKFNQIAETSECRDDIAALNRDHLSFQHFFAIPVLRTPLEIYGPLMITVPRSLIEV